MNDKEKEYLARIDEVVANGPYSDDWQSLCTYGLPEWYCKSKLGIFIHWGVYSVPAYYNEWYPRWMQYKSTPVYRHHVAKYGENYAYRKFIDDFKAEKFDARQWVEGFRSIGADFLLPVAEHHDGFKMYDSELSPFNAVAMGPKRDILGELKEACDRVGMTFTASSHFAERWFYYNGARLNGDNEITRGDYPELYGAATLPDGAKTEAEAKWANDAKYSPSEEWLNKWLINTCELVDRYRPMSVWFDWWVSHKAFKPYMRKFLAYYYNRSVEWGGEKVCVQSKFDSIAFGQGIFDCERGQLDNISPFIWQCETSTSYSSWGYVENSKFKTPAQIICNYLDVISKNGVFVLNFGPKSDGTLCPQEQEIIRVMSQWIAPLNDILHKAHPYRVYGEGKKRKAGSFREHYRYTSRDLRFLIDGSKLYVFALAQSKDNVYRVYSLPDNRNVANYNYLSARVVGSDVKATLRNTPKYLKITLSDRVGDGTLPVCVELVTE